MRVLTVINQKGGVGKTTLSVFIAQYFALIRNMRVLVIDLDPQCNLSNQFLKMELGLIDQMHPKPVIPPQHPECVEDDSIADGRPSSADIWLSGTLMEYDTRFPNIKVIPAHGEKLKGVEQRVDVRDPILEFFREFIWDENLNLAADYDIIIIDTSPELKPVTLAGLRAATDILIPCVMTELGTEGLGGMLSHFNGENAERNALNREPVRLVGILANMFKKQGTLHTAFYKALAKNPNVAPNLMKKLLPQFQAYEEATLVNAPSIFSRPPSSAAYRAALDVCDEIANRMGV